MMLGSFRGCEVGIKDLRTMSRTTIAITIAPTFLNWPIFCSLIDYGPITRRLFSLSSGSSSSSFSGWMSFMIQFIMEVLYIYYHLFMIRYEFINIRHLGTQRIISTFLYWGSSKILLYSPLGIKKSEAMSIETLSTRWWKWEFTRSMRLQMEIYKFSRWYIFDRLSWAVESIRKSTPR